MIIGKQFENKYIVVEAVSIVRKQGRTILTLQYIEQKKMYPTTVKKLARMGATFAIDLKNLVECFWLREEAIAQ